MSNNMLDSDRDHDDASQEDVQIIIKTDKHSQQRTVRKDIYESEQNESRTDLAEQQHSNTHGRDNEHKLRSKQSNFVEAEEQFETGTQLHKQQSGIAWLSSGPKEGKS
jgi:hypothetical protein